MAADLTHDYVLVGELVRREILRYWPTVSAFLREHHGISRRALERIMGGDPNSRERIPYLEGALGLPRDALRCVELHDVAGLGELQAERDLVRWVSNEVKVRSGRSVRHASTG